MLAKHAASLHLSYKTVFSVCLSIFCMFFPKTESLHMTQWAHSGSWIYTVFVKYSACRIRSGVGEPMCGSIFQNKCPVPSMEFHVFLDHHTDNYAYYKYVKGCQKYSAYL